MITPQPREKSITISLPFQPESVHAYPLGASSYGVHDMAGNIWVRTHSLLREYPYLSDAKERAQREDLEAPKDEHRVLRGGAFANDRWRVRCAFRLIFLPVDRGGLLGLRVVMHP